MVARIPDYLPPLKKLGFWLTKGRKIAKVPPDPRVRWWSELMAADADPRPAPPAGTGTDDPAAILFSGGTTGQPKGIVLSNRNFIAESMQVVAWGGMREGDSILAILPIFHGFGLGVCVNAVFMAGGKSILVPHVQRGGGGEAAAHQAARAAGGRADPVRGAGARTPRSRTADLSCLRACFCGADTLPRPVKERFEKLVAERGGKVRLLEGYGLTEAVHGDHGDAARRVSRRLDRRALPGHAGEDLPIGIGAEAPIGDEGEICVCGPAVMLGYLDDPEATAQALRVHADGRTWLHTGDLGRMDADGFFYFTVRLKRMIKSSGFNVYPAQVEAVLYQHPLVAEACVVGVPDPAQVERVKAYVVLRDPALRERATRRPR